MWKNTANQVLQYIDSGEADWMFLVFTIMVVMMMQCAVIRSEINRR